MSNNKTTKQTTYKDLSCLRCRKKKAKCSKTRPSCLRCERSNHPCEYPDAPPNLTDLSKKVLDLYDSLRDLEGELLFKYLQPTSSQQLSHYSDQDEPLDECNLEILDTNSSSPIETVTVNLTIPQQTTQQQLESLSPIALDLEKSCSPQPACAQQQQQGQLEEIDWSMSYLSDGISIQATTHTISEFIVFIDKLTRQLFQDFGNTDTSLSTYWDLDDQLEDSTTGINYDGDDKSNNQFNDDDDDELDEDAYLVTVPIFDISYFLWQPTTKSQSSPAPSPISSSTLPTLLPTLLQYVHKTLDNTDTNSNNNNSAASARTSGPPYHHITPLLNQLKRFLPAQADDNHITDFLTDDPLTTLYIMTAYLTCNTFYDNSDDNTLPHGLVIDSLDCHTYTKTLLIDIVFQITPTYATCLSTLLLIWVQVKRQQESTSFSPSTHDGSFLLDLAWRMVSSSPLWHDAHTTKESHWIGASLIYLDIYTITFHSPPNNMVSHLAHDIGSALRHRLSHSLVRHLSTPKQDRTLICMLLESQLMWFHYQVLGLFYTKTTQQQDNTIKVRKVDVDDVLTLVRDLEQWEQRLPDWATWQPPVPAAATTRQLHLTLNIIKILLFRPFSIEFNQQGMEQTYTKTTFLDLSMHSADRLATCLAWNKEANDCWTFAAHQMIWDVVNRVQTTFDFDQDIKLQLDAIVHRIGPLLTK